MTAEWESAGIVTAVTAGVASFCAWIALPYGLPRALVVSGIAFGSLLLLAYVLERRRLLYSPVTLAAVSLGIIFWLRPFIDLKRNDVRLELGLPILAQFPAAVELGALGMLSIAFGLAAPQRPRDSSSGISEPSISLFLRVTAGVLALSALALGVFLAQGGTRVLFAGRDQDAIDFLQASSGYLYTAPLWIFPLGLYAYGRGLRDGRPGLRLTGLTLMIVSQVVAIGLGDRSFFLVALLAIFWVRCRIRGRSPHPALVLTIVPLVLIFGVALPREARVSSDFSAAFDRSISLESGWQQPFLGEDFAMARNLALALNVVPAYTGYGLGETYLAALARPVPESVWPNKPGDVDALLNSAAIYRFSDIEAGFSYSAFSEPYYNFGFAGVVGFGLLAGFGLRRFSAWAFADERSILGIAVSGSIFGLVLVMVRGNLGTNIQRIAFYTGAVLLLGWIARRAKSKGQKGSEL